MMGSVTPMREERSGFFALSDEEALMLGSP
jgi:hypothetical protein